MILKKILKFIFIVNTIKLNFKFINEKNLTQFRRFINPNKIRKLEWSIRRNLQTSF